MTITELIISCGLITHPTLMEAIVRAESGGNPLVIAYGSDPRTVVQPSTKAEAKYLLDNLLANGIKPDVGLGQIWAANFERLGLDSTNVFDECTNLKASERVLLEAYIKTPNDTHSIGRALSVYNTGNQSDGYSNGYVVNIISFLSGDSKTVELRNKTTHSAIAKDATNEVINTELKNCLLYTSPSPRDQRASRMPSSA